LLVLGIETTCDETACSVVRSGHEILSNIISSQTDLHKRYGGVYPELASRSHTDTIVSIIDLSLKKAKVSREAIDLIAVAMAPGLIGSLAIGLNAAKALSMAWNIPFIGVNHVEAHLYAAMMNKAPTFPSLGVVLSGGHTFIVKILELGHYELLGTTIDDAIGEAFDKVATLLDLPYPGGPEIEKLAKEGDPTKYRFTAGSIKNKPLHFSFSGLKTNVLYAIKGANANKHSKNIISQEEKKHIAASFQRAAFTDVVEKTLLAAKLHGCTNIFLGGGVTQSTALKNLFAQKTPQEFKLYYPAPGLSLDNGAMIAGLGYHIFLQKKQGDSLSLAPLPRLPL